MLKRTENNKIKDKNSVRTKDVNKMRSLSRREGIRNTITLAKLIDSSHLINKPEELHNITKFVSKEIKTITQLKYCTS